MLSEDCLLGTSDFDAQMSCQKNLKGDEIQRSVYKKKRFPKYWVVASILNFLVHKKYLHTDPNMRWKPFFLWLGRMGYQKIGLFILISKMYIWPL
jgi:hypothetical protein